MIGLRIVGCALFLFAGAGAGFQLTALRRRRWLAAEQLERFFCFVRDAVHYQGLPSEEILHRLQEMKGMELLGLESCRYLDELCLPPIFSHRDREMFAPCLSQIGKSGEEELCGMLERCRSLCKQREDELREEYRQAKKLFVPLCTSGAAVLMILLL